MPTKKNLYGKSVIPIANNCSFVTVSFFVLMPITTIIIIAFN